MGQKIIFLSYRRGDSPGYVKSLEKELEAHYGPGSVFRDVKDIAGGAKWKQVIENNLRNAAALLLIIGPRWDAIWCDRIDDEVNYVEYELNFAHNLGVPVIPITLDGAYISNDTDLKTVSWLRENQTYDMSDKQGRWENDFKGLIALLENIPGINNVKSKVRPERLGIDQHTTPQPKKHTGKIKTVLATLGAVFVALFLIGIFVGEPESKAPQKDTAVVSPGFDCNQASTQIERIICANDEISSIDGQMGLAYEQLAGQLDQARYEKLKTDQIAWLKKRDGKIRNSCVQSGLLNTGCVVDIYEKRIDRLRQMANDTQSALVQNYPDLTGTWRSNTFRTIYLVEQSSTDKIKISGYAEGEANFIENMPNKIQVELYGLGQGEFSVSNSSDKIIGTMNYYDGTVEHDTLVKIR